MIKINIDQENFTKKSKLIIDEEKLRSHSHEIILQCFHASHVILSISHTTSHLSNDLCGSIFIGSIGP